MKVIIQIIRRAYCSGEPIETMTFDNVTNIRQEKDGYIHITNNGGSSGYDRVIEIKVWP